MYRRMSPPSKKKAHLPGLISVVDGEPNAARHSSHCRSQPLYRASPYDVGRDTHGRECGGGGNHLDAPTSLPGAAHNSAITIAMLPDLTQPPAMMWATSLCHAYPICGFFCLCEATGALLPMNLVNELWSALDLLGGQLAYHAGSPRREYSTASMIVCILVNSHDTCIKLVFISLSQHRLLLLLASTSQLSSATSVSLASGPPWVVGNDNVWIWWVWRSNSLGTTVF